MQDCIFCSIDAGTVPTQKLYEDEYCFAILDIHPVAPGHTLLIPKKHYAWFYELPDDVSDHLFRAAKKLSIRLKDTTNADYIKLSIVGKDVAHTHVHLIPENR